MLWASICGCGRRVEGGREEGTPNAEGVPSQPDAEIGRTQLACSIDCLHEK